MTTLNRFNTSAGQASALWQTTRPLARKKLSEVVEEKLELMIRSHEFTEGEQLPSERELMAFFQVGRPSVREALAGLKRKGLLHINNGERARVCRPSAAGIISGLSGMAQDFLSKPGGIGHFEQLRLFFESSLVRYAAEYASEQQIARLNAALQLNQQALDDNQRFIRSDIEFHRVLAAIPENPIFLAIHTALLDWLLAARPAVPVSELHQHNNTSYQQHIAICQAIINRDASAAEQALQTHLKSVFSAYYPALQLPE